MVPYLTNRGFSTSSWKKTKSTFEIHTIFTREMCTSVNVYVTQSGDVDERVAAEFFEGPPRARLSPLKLASRESEMRDHT